MRPLVGAPPPSHPPWLRHWPYAIGLLSVLSCPVCLSVNLVYCGQTVGWIKMKFGMQVGLLCPGHNVLDGDPPFLPQRGTAPPQFSAHICCGKMAGWIKMPLGMEVGFGPGGCVRWGPSSPQKGAQPHILTHVYCGQMAVCIRMPLGTEEGFSLGDIVLDGDSAPHVKGHSSPLHFWPMFIVAKRLDGSRYHLVRT